MYYRILKLDGVGPVLQPGSKDTPQFISLSRSLLLAGFYPLASSADRSNSGLSSVHVCYASMVSQLSVSVITCIVFLWVPIRRSQSLPGPIIFVL